MNTFFPFGFILLFFLWLPCRIFLHDFFRRKKFSLFSQPYSAYNAILPEASGSPMVLKPVIGPKVRDQIATESVKPSFLGIVSATETAAIRMENDSFPTLAGLGIVFDVETIQHTIESFFLKE
jgi:hypothetical protein